MPKVSGRDAYLIVQFAAPHTGGGGTAHFRGQRADYQPGSRVVEKGVLARNHVMRPPALELPLAEKSHVGRYCRRTALCELRYPGLRMVGVTELGYEAFSPHGNTSGVVLGYHSQHDAARCRLLCQARGGNHDEDA